MTIVVRVRFDESKKEYCYLCDYRNVKVGDRVIVESPYNGYTAVSVVNIYNRGDHGAGNPTKYVVNIIDDGEYLARKAQSEYLEKIQKLTDEIAAAEHKVKFAEGRYVTLLQAAHNEEKNAATARAVVREKRAELAKLAPGAGPDATCLARAMTTPRW